MTRLEFRLTTFLIAAMFVAVFSCSRAHAQTPRELLDAQDANRDAAIAERAEIDRIIGEQIIELKNQNAEIEERLDALENASPPDPEPPVDDERKIQIGYFFSNVWSPEQPYIDKLAANGPLWVERDTSQPGWPHIADLRDLVADGVVDAETGMPNKGTRRLVSPGLFPLRWIDAVVGRWRLEWSCENAGPCADVNLQGIKAVTKGEGFIVFDVSPDEGNGEGVITVAERYQDMADISLFRLDDEADFRNGKVWRPALIDNGKQYHVIRTMDLQNTNQATIRRADQVPPLSFPWNGLAFAGAQYEGPPIQRLLELGVQTGAEIWLQTPTHLGYPVDEISNATARTNAKAIVDSPEWRNYADKLAIALIESGYPSDRPLYVSYSNEVWNFLFANTHYVNALAQGLYDEEWEYRRAYGEIMARLAVHMEAALKQAGREQKIIYVIEGQAAAPYTIIQSLRGAKNWADRSGIGWESLAPKFGTSVASYWGNGNFPDDLDYGDFDALTDHFLNGSATHWGTINAILSALADINEMSQNYGVKMIGAYEGGSHFNRPPSMTRADYDAWLYGADGGRVNAAVNDAIRDVYPDFILSNYVWQGPRGEPWLEGLSSDNNPLAESWDKYLRPVN